ncbi:MAG: hypothetical protein ACM3Q2_18680 [Syntrophothermus sp.]
MSDKRKNLYFLTPVLLAVIVFASNFLDAQLFKFGELNFAVWFVLSIFSFACGWLINKTLGWKTGGHAVFAVIVATSVCSVALVTFFREYFGTGDTLTENLIIYSLRNVVLGCMAFFGMTMSEVIILQKQLSSQELVLEAYDKLVLDAKREAELELRDARIKAEQIIKDAEFQARIALEKKEKIERELREFIQIEKELIKKYGDND